MQLLFRLLEEKAPLDRGAGSRRLTEGCYPNDQIVVLVRQRTLKPRTPPPLRGTSPHRGGIWML